MSFVHRKHIFPLFENKILKLLNENLMENDINWKYSDILNMKIRVGTWGTNYPPISSIWYGGSRERLLRITPPLPSLFIIFYLDYIQFTRLPTLMIISNINISRIMRSTPFWNILLSTINFTVITLPPSLTYKCHKISTPLPSPLIYHKPNIPFLYFLLTH